MSFGKGSSLKGYEWLRGEEVIMTYLFKYEELTLYTDVSQQEYEEFVEFLNKNTFRTIHLDLNGHQITK